jgi:hypothetical protein
VIRGGVAVGAGVIARRARVLAERAAPSRLALARGFTLRVGDARAVGIVAGRALDVAQRARPPERALARRAAVSVGQRRPEHALAVGACQAGNLAIHPAPVVHTVAPSLFVAARVQAVAAADAQAQRRGVAAADLTAAKFGNQAITFKLQGLKAGGACKLRVNLQATAPKAYSYPGDHIYGSRFGIRRLQALWVNFYIPPPPRRNLQSNPPRTSPCSLARTDRCTP